MTLSDVLRPCAIVVAFVIALSACQSSQAGRVIYEQGRNIVQLQTDPLAVKESARELSTQPATVTAEQLALILRGLTVRSEAGLVGRLLSSTNTAEAVFDDQEVHAFAPVLADALARASPTERVTFTYWSSKPIRRNTPITGTIAVRDPDLRFALDEHPAGGPQGPDDTSRPKRFTLGFVRPTYVRAAVPDDSWRNVGRNSSILIDYKRFLQDPTVRQAVSVSPIPDVPTTSSALSAESLVLDATTRQEAALRQQIKELTDSNQELRRTIRELKDELAETKQLMADKVLELNRMKNKSGGRGKSKTPSSR